MYTLIFLYITWCIIFKPQTAYKKVLIQLLSVGTLFILPVLCIIGIITYLVGTGSFC